MMKQLNTAMAAALLLASVTVQAQTGATATKAAPAGQKKTRATRARKHVETAQERDIRELQEKLAAQQAQIDALTQQNSSKDAALTTAQQSAATAQSAAEAAQTQAQAATAATQQQTEQVNSLKSTVTDLQTTNTGLATTISDTKKQVGTDFANLSDLAKGKVQIGATFFGDYVYYNKTGFGPQFLTQMNQEGPGNDGFNTFDVTRTYLNFLYTPVSAVTLRFTPNIYRMANGSSTAIGDGNNAQIGGSTNGNLGFRLKYAYVQFNHPFKGAFAKGNIRLGQTMNPLVDWEEGLYGYRFVNLTPWNYLSLSSTYVGAEVNGPIMSNGKEYLDYQFGAFNTASFHAIEQNDKKQAMGRLTFYPFGTKVDRTGLGVTIFENYGYNTKTPDTKSTPLNRLAILAHYQSTKKGYEIAGEYDLGRNAISTGQLFSGAGPTSTGKYAAFNSLATALVAGDKTRQQGFAVFGHAQLGPSPFKVFGMIHGFQPNTKISGDNPLDFRRIVGGISYDLNKYLTFALDDQNLTYTHDQFTMTRAQIATFSSSLAAANPAGIPNAVPTSTNAIFMNVQFSY